MVNRTAVQTDETELPLEILLWGERKCNKIQIWVTLIANLLLMVLQKRIRRTWSFSGLATMVRIMLMYYVNCYTFFEDPEYDWSNMMEDKESLPLEQLLF